MSRTIHIAIAAVIVSVSCVALQHGLMAGIELVPTALADQIPQGAAGPGLGAAAGAALGPGAVADIGIPAETINAFAVTAGWLMYVLNFLSWMLFFLLDKIMDPTWIFDLQVTGEDGALLNMLHQIWQLCRDLVNIGFALLLLAGAIRMIIMADTSKIKEKMPKFIIALILVNFSWFIPRAIFDVSQVLAYTAYQIPSIIGADGCKLPPENPGANGNNALRDCEIIVDVVFLEETDKVDANGVHETKGAGWHCPLPLPFEFLFCYKRAQVGAAADPQPRSKILSGLFINYARMNTLTSIVDPRGGPRPAPVIGRDPFDVLRKTLNYVIKIIIVLFIQIALFFPLLALTAAFFLRIPVLWVTMAFMPLVAVGYVMGEHLKAFNPMEVILKQFLQAVFIPVKVAIPFVIGFMMLNVGALTRAPGAIADLAPISLISEVRDLWQMIWLIIALGIIWRYSFKVLKADGDSIIGMFTDRIEGFGKTLGQIAYRAPLSIPFMPMPGGKPGEKVSPMQLKDAFNLQQINQDLRASGNIAAVKDRVKAKLQGGVTNNINVGIEVYEKMNNKEDVSKPIKIVIDPNENDNNKKLRALKESLKKLRAADPNSTKGIRDMDLVESLIKALRIEKKEDQDKLRDLVQSRDMNGGLNTD